MAAQGLLFRSCKVLCGRSLLNNRISHVNLQLSAMGLKQDTREKLKQLKIPEKPKRPLSPYVRFVSEHRIKILKSNPDIKSTDIIRKCADEWKNLNSKVKDKYVEAFNKEREDYDVKLLKYNEGLTSEQKNIIHEVQEEKKEDSKKRKLRKLYKETNKPKKPMGAYMRYLIDQSKTRNQSFKDLMTNLKDEYAKLPEPEKQKYNNLFLKDKHEYEVALEEWEDRMVKEGREDLIRRKSSDEPRPSRIKQLKKKDPQ